MHLTLKINPPRRRASYARPQAIGYPPAELGQLVHYGGNKEQGSQVRPMGKGERDRVE
jgi:hypothetical protein